MFRLILVLMTVATVALVVAAVFFADGGPVGEIDREAMDLYTRGKYAEALDAWERGLAEYPDSGKLQYRIGTMFAVRGNFGEGARHLERAVAIEPDEPLYRRELAICYLQDERYADAEREFDEVIRQAKWYPEAHYFLGVCYEKQGRGDLARQMYIKELNENANCAYAWATVHQRALRKAPAPAPWWLWVAGGLASAGMALVLLRLKLREGRPA